MDIKVSSTGVVCEAPTPVSCDHKMSSLLIGVGSDQVELVRCAYVNCPFYQKVCVTVEEDRG
jgi:hypothetical protein